MHKIHDIGSRCDEFLKNLPHSLKLGMKIANFR